MNGTNAQLAGEGVVRDLEGLARAGRWEWDVQSDRVQWSEELRQIYGVDGQGPDGYQGFLDRVHPDDLDHTRAVIERAFQERAPQEYQHRIVRRDGEVRVLRSLVRVDTDDDGQVVRLSGACQDVTPQVALAERLRRAQGLASSGLVAAGLAHDLNNLLGAVMFTGGALARLVRSAGIETSLVDSLEQVTRRAAELTGRIQGLASSGPAVPVHIDPGATVQHAASLLRNVVPPSIALEAHVFGDVGRVLIDLGDLERVLWNLVVNARDAQRSGGRIELHVRGVSAAGSTERDYVRISVRDHGAGMDEATRRRLFEPLFTTKGTAGSGLGLAVVHDIVRGAGGFITVASELGRGTWVHVHFPRAD